MFLGCAYALYEQELICDFAEYYSIYDIWSLPILTVATLCAGLREDSRLQRKLQGFDYCFEQEMLMHIYDCVRWIQWSQSADAQRNVNKPKSVFEALAKVNNQKTDDPNAPIIFDSPEELQEALDRRKVT